MQVISVAEASDRLFDLIDHVNKEHDAVVIDAGAKRVVLVGAERWQSLQDQLEAVTADTIPSEPTTGELFDNR